MFEFSSPWFLVLLVAIPVLGWRLLSRATLPSFALSTAFRAAQVVPSWRQKTMVILPLLETVIIGLLVIALARPRNGLVERARQSEGLAIEVAIDRSGSMAHDDFKLSGKWVTRLEAVQDAAKRFVAGDQSLPGRMNDLVGIVTFARYAERASPLTIDHQFVLARLGQIGLVPDFRDDGTAIGDALGLAVADLHEYERHRTMVDRKPLRKVVVILSDGEQNAGEFEPPAAAALANAVGVKVYAIGIRPAAEARTTPDQGTTTLQQIARTTGGQFFLASSTEALASIYGQIDRLEKSTLDEVNYTDYREWAIEPIRVGSLRLPALASVAVLLLAVRMVLGRTMYRTIP